MRKITELKEKQEIALGILLYLDEVCRKHHLIYFAADGTLLGVQAVGHGVSELSAAFGLALEMRARLEDVAATIHAHPTRGEAFQEAALRGLGHALHI